MSRFKTTIAAGLAAICMSCSTTETVVNTKEIVLSPLVKNNLEFLYGQISKKEPAVEFPYCGLGHVRNDTTYVTHGEIPQIIYTNRSNGVFHPCNQDDYVAFFHSHPDGPEYLSGIDIGTALRDKQAQWFGVITNGRVYAWHIQDIRAHIDTTRINK